MVLSSFRSAPLVFILTEIFPSKVYPHVCHAGQCDFQATCFPTTMLSRRALFRYAGFDDIRGDLIPACPTCPLSIIVLAISRVWRFDSPLKGRSRKISCRVFHWAPPKRYRGAETCPSAHSTAGYYLTLLYVAETRANKLPDTLKMCQWSACFTSSEGA